MEENYLVNGQPDDIIHKNSICRPSLEVKKLFLIIMESVKCIFPFKCYTTHCTQNITNELTVINIYYK